MSTPVVEVPENPFKNIALSLSGGGYRAAGFHLGVMDLLDELDRLDEVIVLSTVSGGTITGMLYAVNQAKGLGYDEFYARGYKFLAEVNVIERALVHLQSGHVPGQDSLSLIRSAAQVYAERLFEDFGDITLGELFESQHLRMREIIFNATEFRHGLAFRFLKSQSERAIFGNKYFPVSPEVARRVHLADIVAASSCFPGAFEPINFPDDFRWADANGLDDTRRALGEAFKDKNGGTLCLPLMDGGIYDNQGLESIELASNRAKGALGMIIISDTGQRSDAILDSVEKRKEGGVKLGVLAWVFRIIFILSCITIIAVVMEFFNSTRKSGLAPFAFAQQHLADFAFLYVMPTVLAATVAGLLLWLRMLIHRKRRVEVAGTTFDVWAVIRRLSVWDLFGLLQLRADSLIAMSSTIFLNRVRSQSFRRFAKDKAYKKRTVFNLIYRINTNNPGLVAKDPGMKPSEALVDLAARMEKVETTLWLRNEDEIKDLIACGQATACFNLVRYLWKVYEHQINSHDARIYPVYSKAMDTWEKLKHDPRSLLKRDRTRPRAQTVAQTAKDDAYAPSMLSTPQVAADNESTSTLPAREDERTGKSSDEMPK